MEWKYTIGEMEENTCQELANSIVKLLDCSNFFTARQYTNLRIESEQLTKFTKLTTVTFPTKNYGDIIVKTINHTITDGYGTQCDIIIGGPDGKQFSRIITLLAVVINTSHSTIWYVTQKIQNMQLLMKMNV